MAIIVSFDADGGLVVHAGQVSTADELSRLDLVGTKTVRVREVPAEFDVLAKGAAEQRSIPSELRGRLGTVVRFGSLGKYDVTAVVRLHRARPGEAQQTLTLPLAWLERADG